MILFRRTIRLSAGPTPPTEFRIFAAGKNDSTKGAVVFDAKAARSVMRAYETQGVEVMIDLEHLSLDSESRSYDPDARGWCKLEVRNGELWATDVRWTPEGARRLRERRQRYISPAFYAPKGRVLEVVNVAICAMPATHDAPALVAANRRARRAQRAAARRRSRDMDPELIKKAIEALKNGDGDAALAMLESLIAAAAGADAAPVDDAEAMTDDEDPEAMADEDKDPEALADDPDDDTKEAKRTRRATRAATESARMIAAMSAEIAKLKRRSQRDDVRELVRLNADRIPPTLEKWALSQTPETLSEYLKHAPKQRVAQPPQTQSSADVEMTEEDLKVCKLTGTDPEKFLKFKRETARKVV